MITLVSRTRRAEESAKQFRKAIGVTPFRLQAFQNSPHLDSIEAQKTAELSLAQQPLPVCFGRKQIDPQRCGTIGIGFMRIKRRQSPRTCRACSSLMPPFA